MLANVTALGAHHTLHPATWFMTLMILIKRDYSFNISVNSRLLIILKIDLYREFLALSRDTNYKVLS